MSCAASFRWPPLHQPHNLAGIDALSAALPGIPQEGCFDTAFYRSQPELAQLFALPRAITAQGARRYGFHGLSCEYIAEVLRRHLDPARARGRVIVAHLGNGASMCAMKALRSQASTMGFTAVDGLMMVTRTGTGGIGERGVPVRERVCARLDWLGLRLNPAASAASAPRISAADSQIDVCVIPTNEEWIIARHVADLIA